MKIFGKRDKSVTRKNALPGVFALFEQSFTVIGKDRMLYAGYASWALIPALLTFGLSYFTLSSTWQFFAENTVLVLDLVLSIWVSACIMLLTLSRLRKETIGEKDLSHRVRQAMPLLIYLFGFSFLCLGLYLFIIPGILASVWLAFVDIIPLEQKKSSFIQTLKESRRLSKGRFFSVLWRLLLGELLYGMLFLFLCTAILSGLFALAHIDAQALAESAVLANAELPAWISLLVTALALPLLPYTLSYRVALYEALKKA